MPVVACMWKCCAQGFEPMGKKKGTVIGSCVEPLWVRVNLRLRTSSAMAIFVRTDIVLLLYINPTQPLVATKFIMHI